MSERDKAKEFDWWLLFLALGICVLGVIEIYSATQDSNLRGMHWRQSLWIAVGLVCMAILARVDYHVILEHAPALYLVGVIGLVLVLVVGQTRFGHRSWLAMGGASFQVSEIMKLIIIISLARFFSEVRGDRLSLVDLVKAGALVGLPLLLILKQPDVGTAAMTAPILLMGAFLAGLQWRHAVAIGLVVMMLLPAGWMMLKPYQKDRILTFIRPDANGQTAGYQTQQMKIAVGSGGLLGKGVGQGSQNQLGFIPVRWADSIFAALAEELGFAGVCTTLLLYMALLLRLVQIAQRASDRAGMHIVMGVAAVMGMHILWNVAMVIGYLPLTGIPLPLMSYGGSATLFVFMALGLVMNVRMNRFVN